MGSLSEHLGALRTLLRGFEAGDPPQLTDGSPDSDLVAHSNRVRASLQRRLDGTHDAADQVRQLPSDRLTVIEGAER